MSDAKPDDKKSEQPKVKEPLPSIYLALPRITAAVQPIAKSRENKQQGYSFRGVEDVYAMLNLLLAENGVTILPEVIENHHEQFASKSGGVLFRSRLLVRYHLLASDKTEVCAVVPGEGMDSGDKATPKALSCAYKYMAFQVFCIPTGEKIDTENDSHEVATTGKQTQNGTATAAATSNTGNGQRAVQQQDAASAALCEEHKQAIMQAKDEDAIKKVGVAVMAEHKAHRINDTQRNALKKMAELRRTELGIGATA